MNEMLDAIASELLQAIEKKDKRMLVDALTALCMHLDSDDDQTQDAETMEE